MTERIILITGASRGIGAAAATTLARDGYTVAVNYRAQRAAADAVVGQIERDGARAFAVAGDVATEADVLAIFKALDARGGRLAGLVNNAGVVAPASRVDAYDMARLRRIFDINVIGSFLCAREAIKRMSTRYGGAGGVIVNVSSAAARIGSPNEYVDYAAAKGAIDTFTIGLAKELAEDGIRVNAVRPGIIDTEIHASGGEPGRVERLKPMVPMKRAGTAQEVADAIAWLVSPKSSYATGALIDVSGGR